jgi:alkylation response protein AidB-like acyl-CoA dehydrogenase
VLDALLASLFGDVPTPLACDGVGAFLEALARPPRGASPVEDAALGGFAADRLGYAFAAGYEAALRALLGGARDDLGIVTLCATEAGGAHPRAIEACLREDGARLRLRGHKRWSTMAPAAQTLLVLASRGEGAGGRKALVLAAVPRGAPGVVVSPMPPPPFAPEIPHAEVVFEDVEVPVEAVLPGDGWTRWVKPFRTVEDVHVHAALLGYATSLARRVGAGREVATKLAASLTAVCAIAALSPDAPATHLALAGAIEVSREALAALEPAIEAAPGEETARWARDRVLLEVAGKARAQRLERAFSRLGEAR